jgi:spermidine synthase
VGEAARDAADRKAPAAGTTSPAPALAATTAPDVRPQLMLVLFALSGAVSLSTQIAWSRVAGILLGSSVYSFSLVLATFLLGIAAGAALIVPLITKKGPSWRLFAVLQWIAAGGILYASIRIADAPWDLLSRIVMARGNVRGLWIQESLLLAGFMLPACLAFGAIFPVATRLSAFPGDTASHTTGRAYGWNTFGTITGSLLAGFLLVHWLGMHGTLLGVAGVALVIGAVAWFAAPRPAKKRSSIPEGAPITALAVPALLVAAFILAVVFSPPWNRGLLSVGVFRPLVATNAMRSLTPESARNSLREQMAKEELLSFVEGRQGTVTVHKTRTLPPIIAIRFNGKTDASTSIDMSSQILVGQLPMMWAPDSARVAIVGYGSGVTVGSVLTHPVKSVDVVEIEPAVLSADQYFRPYNNDPTHDPRLTVHFDDGRMFIAHAPRAYEVIISEPSNPWLAGVNNLFTVEYYKLIKQHLKKGGVFCQWMQFYEMSGVTLGSLMRSLHEVFPKAQIFLSNRDILFVATEDDRPLDLRQVARRLERPQVAKDLARANIRTPADLVGLRQASLPAVLPNLPAAPLNLDDRPFVEYRAPVDLYSVPPSELPFSEQSVRDSDPLADLGQWTTGESPFDLAIAVTNSLMARGNLSGANRWLKGLMAHNPSRAEPLLEALRTAARESDFTARLVQARQAFEAGNIEASRRLAEGLLRENPESSAALIVRGRVSMHADSLDAAGAMFRRALPHANDDDIYDAQVNLGVLFMRQGKTDEGLAHFAEANRVRPKEASAWLYRASALGQLGKVNEARLLLEQARGQVTDATALESALRQLDTRGTHP